MQKTLRDLWLGHIFWVQRVVLFNTTIDPAEREAAEKQVLANANAIAQYSYTVLRRSGLWEVPCPADGPLCRGQRLLRGHHVGEYDGQDAALARLASNADDLGVFLNGVNPYHLPKDTVRGLIAAHGAHHVLQINQYKKKEYAHSRGNLDDDARTRLCHCGYAHDGIGEAVSEPFS